MKSSKYLRTFSLSPRRFCKTKSVASQPIKLDLTLVRSRVPIWGSLLYTGSLGFSRGGGGWRASESNEYIGGLGKRMMSARRSFAFFPFPWYPSRPLFSLFISLEASAEHMGYKLSQSIIWKWSHVTRYLTVVFLVFLCSSLACGSVASTT